MFKLIVKTAAGVVALSTLTVLAGAQSASPTQAPSASVVVAKPTYTSILLEVAVARPAADVWKRVGKYCDVGEWLRVACTITAGKDGEVGAVRSVGGGEVLVGRSEWSYTYAQPPRCTTARSRRVRFTPTSSTLIYTLFFDNSMLADDAAREADKVKRTTQSQTRFRT